MLKYTEDHEWLRAEGDEIVVGITRHASEQLGDVVFVELPEEGRAVEEGEGGVDQRGFGAEIDALYCGRTLCHTPRLR